jgi:hypothetical protein
LAHGATFNGNLLPIFGTKRKFLRELVSFFREMVTFLALLVVTTFLSHVLFFYNHKIQVSDFQSHGVRLKLTCQHVLTKDSKTEENEMDGKRSIAGQPT